MEDYCEFLCRRGSHESARGANLMRRYVGTKMGIFELTTDIRDRMMYSGIVFR